MTLKQHYISSAVPMTTRQELWMRVKRLLTNPLGQFLILGALLALAQILNLIGILPKSVMTTIAFVAIYSIAAIGFCLLLGYSGLASLGTAGFMGLGIFIAYNAMQKWGTTLFPALVLAAALSIIAGIVVGFISLRIEGIYLAIMTLALSEIIVKLFKTIEGGTWIINRSKLTFFGLPLPQDAIFFIIVFVLIMLLIFTSNLINSPTGRAMIAMKASTAAAQAMGISLMKYRLLSFVISTLFAGVSGFLYISYMPAMTPSTSTILLLSMSLNILGAVIVGGAKSLWGTLFGTFFIFGFQTIFLQEITFFKDNPAFMVMATGALIIVITMFFPGGFAQILMQLKYYFKRKKYEWRVRKYGTEA